MRIPCPFCGERDSSEFVCRGEAGPARPDTSAPGTQDALYDYLYLRNNPAGPTREHWYHAYGCRRWMVVDRDTRTHEIFAAHLVQEAKS